MTEIYYKTLTADGRSPIVEYQWPLPDGKPGKWITATGGLELCSNGIHLCRRSDLVAWLNAQIYTAEVRGEIIEGDDKIVCREARLVDRVAAWNDRTARLFTADCAEHALHFFESAYPGDERPRAAIAAARAFARGEIDTATRDAARAAAGAAADTAARAAADTAAWDAAEAAAWAAARAATRDAARAGTRAAEREWQTIRLFEYLEGHAQ